MLSCDVFYAIFANLNKIQNLDSRHTLYEITLLMFELQIFNN